MSLSANYPALAPNLLLDFSNSAVVDPRVTVTRASTATYYNGLTYAKAEENLLLQSQDFTTSWVNVGTTGTANTSVAPDGTTTADTLTEDSATSIHVISQVVAVSGTVTLSVFAKLGSGTRFLTIGLNRDTTHTASATFDLSLGTNTQTQANGGIYTSPSATITATAQGFYRCTFTVTTDTANSIRIGLNDTGTPTTNNRAFGVGYTGDSTSSLIIWGAQLEQRSAATAYTATTTQPITNYIQALQTAQNNVPRIDHNPVTNATLGLLIEEQRTNSVIQSEDFAGGSWTKGNATVTSNTIVAPNGTLTGDKLVEDTATNTHLVQPAISISYTSGTSYTYSVFAKAAERTFLQLRVTASATFSASFNLSTGVASQLAANTTAAVSNVGNGWYRCSITFTATATAGGTSRIGVMLNETTNNYLGDGYSGIYIWGAQLEAGAFVTSYIPTTTTALTRNADALSLTGTNFSSWYNAGEGTIYGQSVIARQPAATANILAISDGTADNFIDLRYRATGTVGAQVVTLTAVQVNNTTGPTATANLLIKDCFAFAVNNAAESINGLTPIIDLSISVPTVNRMFIGANPNGNASFLNGHIQRIAYYPLRNTNAQLQALTG